MKLLLMLGLVAGSLAFGATRAAAQWNPTSVCEDPVNPPSLFQADTFVGLSNCSSLCAQAARVCKKFVKDAVACDLSSYNGRFKIQLGLCSEEHTDAMARKACVAEIKGEKQVAEQGFQSEQADGFSGCEAFLSSCTFDCEPNT
jgi:hypothetical protein